MAENNLPSVGDAFKPQEHVDYSPFPPFDYCPTCGKPYYQQPYQALYYIPQYPYTPYTVWC